MLRTAEKRTSKPNSRTSPTPPSASSPKSAAISQTNEGSSRTALWDPGPPRSCCSMLQVSEDIRGSPPYPCRSLQQFAMTLTHAALLFGMLHSIPKVGLFCTLKTVHVSTFYQ